MRVLPFKGLGEGAGCNKLLHRVDEGGKVVVLLRVRPIASPLLVADATQNHGVHRVDHFGQSRAELFVEAVELELEGVLHHAVH
ncbi:hypothetical protein D3C74_477490 [compost metagenome]